MSSRGSTSLLLWPVTSAVQIVVVSSSCDGTNVRAALWEDGSLVDLNTMIAPNSSLQLFSPQPINDRGEIAGLGLPSGCFYDGLWGRAFVLRPCDENHPGIEGCDYSMVEAAEVSNGAVATRAPQSTQLGKEAIARMMGASRNPFFRRYRMPVLRTAPSE